MILILGNQDEAHAAFIQEKIRRRGKQAAFFDTTLFPSRMQLGLTPDAPESGWFSENPDSPKIPFDDIVAVYWRYHLGVTLDKGIEEPFHREMAYREIDATFGSLFRNLDCLWVNPADAIEQHRYKGHQLQLLGQAGLRIPRTLITNNPDAVRAFQEELDGQVIYKPVRGGAHTEKIKTEDLSDARLSELAKSPVQFQEMIEGTDIRVYLVGDELFAAEIRSSTLDFRNDPGADIVPLTLPDPVAKDCRLLAKTLGLVFSGIDIRRTPAGEYVFIEGNPSPMFIHFENVSGYPISDRLVEMLIRGRA